MAVKASATITLSHLVDIVSTTRYYKLQSSTAAAPSKPTANPPSGWSKTEPTYTAGSTNTLYFVDCTVFSNATFAFSEVSKSSSYEAAKEAYNKAQAAKDAVDNMEIGGRNLLQGSKALKNGDKDFYATVVTVNDKYGDFTCSKTNSAWQGPAWDMSTIMSRCGLKPGDEVTYSVMVMVDFTPDKPCSFSLYRAASASMDVGTLTMEKDQWYKISKSFTLDEGSVVATRTRLETNYYKTIGDLTTDYKYDFEDGYMYFAAPKLEKGSKATDWTPAPEDLETEITQTKQELTDYKTETSTNLDSITASVTETRTELTTTTENVYDALGRLQDTAVSTEELESVKQLLITQWSDQLEYRFTQVTNLINSTNGTVAENQRLLEQYIRFEGARITLGRSDSAIQAVLSNDRLEFVENGQTVAYISNRMLYITDAHITGSLSFGNADTGLYMWRYNAEADTFDLEFEGDD